MQLGKPFKKIFKTINRLVLTTKIKLKFTLAMTAMFKRKFIISAHIPIFPALCGKGFLSKLKFFLNE